MIIVVAGLREGGGQVRASKSKFATVLKICVLGWLVALGVSKILPRPPQEALIAQTPLGGPPQGGGAYLPPAGPSGRSGSEGSQGTKKDRSEVQEVQEFRKFQDKFGSDLEPQFNSEGHLIAVRGTLGQGAAAAPDFTTQDPQKVTLRGQEIVNAAQDLLGLRSELPLSSPIPREGPVTAQLYFRETYRGLTLLPEGTLKIDLGPKGEILELSSDYLAKLNVVSEVRLTSEEALAKALSSVERGTAHGLRPAEGNRDSNNTGGNKVVWVVQAGPSAGPGAMTPALREMQGHVAYQFFVRGREVVIDAGTGLVLFSRNRRQQ